MSCVRAARGREAAISRSSRVINNQEKVIIDWGQIVGSAKEIKGVVKEIDKTTGDAKLQADGEADRLEGKLQNAIGGAKDTVRDALKKSDALRLHYTGAADQVSNRPAGTCADWS